MIDYLEVLADLRQRRDALDAAIAAISPLVERPSKHPGSDNGHSDAPKVRLVKASGDGPGRGRKMCPHCHQHNGVRAKRCQHCFEAVA